MMTKYSSQPMKKSYGFGQPEGEEQSPDSGYGNPKETIQHQAFVLALKEGGWKNKILKKGPNKLDRLKDSLSIDKSRLSIGNELRNTQGSVLSTTS